LPINGDYGVAFLEAFREFNGLFRIRFHARIFPLFSR
jgi:hypothetical protein